MVQAASRLLQVAPTDLSVLVTGETGTGKDVFAHALHELSPRKKHPFVSVNCGAIPETLLESELFGAEKGAFTGAVEQRKGFFESAHRGTIFLDEIGEMPVGTQVKLLRILESGEFSRLGSSDMLRVDVRVIAATNRDLLYEVRQGRFRQDLYFRLNSVNIHLPPLRQHLDDLPLLIEYFAERVADKTAVIWGGVDDEAVDVFADYAWPGNVRELRNVVETLVTLERGARITAAIARQYMPAVEQPAPPPAHALALIPEAARAEAAPAADLQMLYRSMLQLTADVGEMKTVLRHLLAMTMDITPPAGPATAVPVRVEPQERPPDGMNVGTVRVNDDLPTLDIATLERMAITTALRRTGGNRRDAAKLLGMSERTLYRKIDDLGLA